MTRFSLQRFGRVMLNDALRVARPVLHYGTPALFGMTMTIYLIWAANGRPADDLRQFVIFGLCLMGAGLLLTSLAFQDMHHPLQRYQYLTLPCSNLERVLSRYLLTGPLFVLYSTLAFMVFDYMGNWLAGIWMDARAPLLPAFAEEARPVILGYLFAHMAVFIGAICFRSHALLKTILFLLLVLLSLVMVENVVGRILFPEAFSWTQFGNIRPFPLELQPWFAAAWMNVVVIIAALAWLFHIAYLCLRDHEATGGV